MVNKKELKKLFKERKQIVKELKDKLRENYRILAFLSPEQLRPIYDLTKKLEDLDEKIKAFEDV